MTADRCPSCLGRSSPAERAALGGCPGCLLALAVGPEPADEEPPLAPGAAFRALEVEKLLGRGGMGFVYRARHLGLDSSFALKILSPALAGLPGFADRFMREARTMAALDHPRIVRITDFGRERDLYFIIMEYVEGTTLRQRIRHGVTAAEALGIGVDLCDALAAAHARDIVHRDIKPENVLLDASGRAKVTDFGLAKALAPGEGAALTRTSAVMGTVRYMAPEQFERMAVDHRADIFSLGAVLYELFTGDLPRGAFPPPSRLARVGWRVDRVILQCLDPSPHCRPSIGRVRSVLDRSRRTSRSTARRFIAPAVAALLAGGAGSVGVAITARREDPAGGRNVPGRWEELGGSGHRGGLSPDPGVARQSALAVDHEGRPVVAWVAQSARGQDIHLRRWDGRAWRGLPGSSGDAVTAAADMAREPALVVDRHDNPILAWTDGHRIQLRWHRGDRWQPVGTEAPGDVSGFGEQVDWPSLALDPHDQPVVAWCHDRRIFLRRFEAGAWRALASSASGDGLSGPLAGECRPSLAMDGGGRPWVAWTRPREAQRDTGDIFVRRWDGARWASVGDAVHARRARSVRLAVAGDRPVLAWRELEPEVRRSWILVMAWNGRAWEGLGDSARGHGLVSEGSSAYRPDLAIDAAGRPVVVWNALVGFWSEHEIYAKRWDGDRWTQLGGSGSGNGISATAGDSGGAAIALDSAGRPTVAWTEAAASNAAILLRRFAPTTD